MEPVYEFGLQATRWLQSNYPQLQWLMASITSLGRFEFFLAVLPLIYWSLDKSLGKRLAYLLSLSYVLNTVLKHSFRQPRPDWLDPSLRLSEETGYGLPSGHAQFATVLYLALAAWVRRRWVWILATVMVVMMSLSRVYLGVHFVHDVVAGFLVGLLTLAGYFVWKRYAHDRFRNRILGQRLLVAVLVAAGFLLLYSLIQLLLGAPSDSVPWASFMPVAETTSLTDFTNGLGILLGLGVGFVLEASRVHFIVDGTVTQRSVRYLFGILITVVIWRGLGAIFPEDPLWLALPLRFFRYWLAGMWVGYYAPLVFVRLRLAQVAPEPDVKHTISDGGIMKG